MRKFRKVSWYNPEEVKLPERSTKYSAGYDFFNPRKIVCKAHMITLVPTGVKAQMANDEVLMLFNRSSNPVKKGLVLINGVGVIDKDYYNNEQNEGEISFAFANTTDKDVAIEMNEKLGQGVFVKYFTTNDDKTENKRKGGFGSTGK